MICTVIKANKGEQMLITKVIAYYKDVKTVFFDNFSDSISFLEQNSVDMVFFSIKGKGNCWEAQYETIKMIDQATKIVLISDNRVDAVKAFELEATDFLLVPISESRLDSSVRKAKES